MDLINKQLGTYIIRKKIGQGGFGTVYLAESISDHNLRVACKVIQQVGKKGALAVSDARREYKILKDLDHPGLPAIIDLLEDNKHFCLVEEYFPGETLKRVFVDDPETVRLSMKKIFMNLCAVMSYVHSKRVVHADIKLENILISKEGTVCLIDFANARKGWERWLFWGRSVTGTRNFMAPEQIQNKRIDNRTDIYAMGIVFYYLLAGVFPFAASHEKDVLRKQLYTKPPKIKRGDVSVGMEQIVRRMLEKDPNNRYQHVGQILQEIKAQPVFREY